MNEATKEATSGRGGWQLSPEQRQAASERARKRNQNPEYRERHRQACARVHERKLEEERKNRPPIALCEDGAINLFIAIAVQAVDDLFDPDPKVVEEARAFLDREIPEHRTRFPQGRPESPRMMMTPTWWGLSSSQFSEVQFNQEERVQCQTNARQQ